MAWTLPNTITSARLGIAILLFAMLACLGDFSAPENLHEVAPGSVRWWSLSALIVFVIAALSDVLDGWYARRYGVTSAFGRVADPFVDKILVCGTFIFLSSSEVTRSFVPPWFVVIVVGREFLVTGIRGFVESSGRSFPARRLGKLKMVVQCLAISAIFLRLAISNNPHVVDGSATSMMCRTLVWATLLFTVVSGAQYVFRARGELFA